MSGTHTVVCGGVPPPADCSGPPLALNLWDLNPEDNVRLRIADLHRSLWRDIPPQFHDLVEIATYVYCADQYIFRGAKDVDTFGARWRRRIHLHIPVRCPDLWSSREVIDPLINALNFLSDDFFEFTFHKAHRPPQFQQYLQFNEEVKLPSAPEQVMMFSGGLDSLAGAVEELIVQRRNAVLVTHASTPKLNSPRGTLTMLLNDRAKPVRPLHLTVRANKQKHLGKDYTQRTRSFLFASLAATVARMLGLKGIRFYENGVLSLNLPVSAQVVGGRATRTTHPRTLAGFQTLFSILGNEPFGVENPFIWLTKAEVIEKIVKAGCGDLIHYTRSCTHTWEISDDLTHCGSCSQCIDRRIGMIAAGAESHDPAEHYKSDVFTQSRPKEQDRLMVAAYLERAAEVARLPDVAAFIAKYPAVNRVLGHLPGDPMNVARRVFDLYLRHSREVNGAVVTLVERHAREIVARSLPPDCLVRTVIDSKTAAMGGAVTLKDTQPENYLWLRGNVWEARFHGGDPILIKKHDKGCEAIHYLLARASELLSVYDVMGELAIRTSDIPPDGAAVDSAELGDGFQITRGAPLSNAGDVADVTAIRKYRVRGKELLDEIADARDFGHTKKQVELEEEMAAITRAINQARTPGRALKKSKDQRKNVRDAFRQNVNRAITEIRKSHPALARHPKRDPALGERKPSSPIFQLASRRHAGLLSPFELRTAESSSLNTLAVDHVSAQVLILVFTCLRPMKRTNELHTALRYLLLTIAISVPGIRADSAELRIIKVGYIPIAECVELYIADKKGFFEQEELKVEMTPMAGGAKILTGVISKDIHIGFTNAVSLVLNGAHGHPLVSYYGASFETQANQNHAVAVNLKWNSGGGFGLIGDKPQIAVNTLWNIEHLFMLEYLQRIYGRTSEDVVFREVTFPDMLTGLQDGRIAAAGLVEPFITLARERMSSSIAILGDQYLAFDSRVLVATYVAHKDFVDTDLGKSFHRAMINANKFLRSNESESRSIIGQFAKVPPEFLGTIALPEFKTEVDVPSLEALITLMGRHGFFERTQTKAPQAETLVWHAAR